MYCQIHTHLCIRHRVQTSLCIWGKKPDKAVDQGEPVLLFWQFFCRSQIGDNSRENLAKFGYKTCS